MEVILGDSRPTFLLNYVLKHFELLTKGHYGAVKQYVSYKT